MRRLFNQRRHKAQRAHVVHGLAEVAGGGGDLAQGALAALDAFAESAAATEDAEDAEDAVLYTAHSSPEAAALPPASQTPIPAPTAEDAFELDTLRTPRGLINAFQQAATRPPSRLPHVSLAHLSLTPAAATPPLDPVPSPALQPTVQPPQPSVFAAHPVANAAHLERVAGHVAGMSAVGKNDKRKHTAAENASKAAGKAAEDEIKKLKKQAGESTSGASHAAQANAANTKAAKARATAKAAITKAEAALAKQEAAIRNVILKEVCAYLILGDYAPCSQ